MSTRQRSLHLVQPQVVHTMHFNMRDSFMRVYYISGGCRIEFYQETTTMPSRAFSNQRATKVASWAFPHPTGQAFQDLESTMAQHAHSIANSILISSLIEYSILISSFKPRDCPILNTFLSNPGKLVECFVVAHHERKDANAWSSLACILLPGQMQSFAHKTMLEAAKSLP